MGVWLKVAMGHHTLLVPFLRSDHVLWVGEVVCVAEGRLSVLKLKLGRGRSFGGGEGGVGLLIRDDCHIIGGKPSALLTEQPVPPS